MFPRRADRWPATIRQCAILVGGLGTRLGALTAATPKPLLPCGDRPFLAWLLRELLRFGVEEFLLLTGFWPSEVERAVPAIAAGLPEPVRIVCCAGAGAGGHRRRAVPCARAARRAVPAVQRRFLARLQPRPPARRRGGRDGDDVVGRMVLRRLPDASRYGVVELRRRPGRRVPRAAGRRASPALINAGIYAVRPPGAGQRHPGLLAGAGRDAGASPPQGALRGTVGDGYFIDIGIPEDLARAQTELPARHAPAGAVPRPRRRDQRRSWLGRHARAVRAGSPARVEAIRAATDAGWHVFVVTNQSGIARGLYDEAQFAALRGWMIDEIRARRRHRRRSALLPVPPRGEARRPIAGSSDWRKPGAGHAAGPDARAGSWTRRAASWSATSRATCKPRKPPVSPPICFPGGDLLTFIEPLLGRLTNHVRRGNGA